MLLNTIRATNFRTHMEPEKDLTKAKSKKRKRLKVTDMRVCPECKKVWSYYHDGNLLRFEYFIDIPKYGLHKQRCPNCELEYDEMVEDE